MKFDIENKSLRNTLITGVAVLALILVSNFFTTRYVVKTTIAEVIPTVLATVLPEAFEQIGITAARPTPPAAPTAKPRATVTPALPILTLTPSPVLPTPTSAGATVTVVATGTGGCPLRENKHHPPQDIICEHYSSGVDMRSPEIAALFNIDGFEVARDFLDKYGALWQPLWVSSANEPILFGHAYGWAVYTNPTCQQDDNGGLIDVSTYQCIYAVAHRFHDDGTIAHGMIPNHSEAVIIRGCTKLASGMPDLNDCWIISDPGMLRNYGSLLTPYKVNICHREGDPKSLAGEIVPDKYIDQPNYIGIQNRLNQDGLSWLYWVGVDVNQVVAEYYPNDPNAFVQMSWNSQAWQIWGTDAAGVPVGCGLATFEETKAVAESFPPLFTDLNRGFQMIQVEILDYPPGPFIGYQDIYGHWQLAGACVEGASPTCVPITITGNAPGGAVSMRYDAIGRGDCSLIPCFRAETFGVPFVFPPLDGYGHEGH